MPICAEIKCKPPHKAIPRPLVRRLARANMELFLEDLDDIIDRHFPKKRLTRKQYKTSKNPWITPEILASIKQKTNCILDI